MNTFELSSKAQKCLSYTLSNKNGLELNVMNYGATITSLKIPIKNEKKIDVVLGFENVEDYINSYDLPSAPYFGCVVGRFAGRINKATFDLNGEKIELTKNHFSHQLHGGLIGFGRKFWEVKSINENDNPSITLKYISDENEENFPGQLITEVTYTLTEENELKISYKATSSEDTIINLTQHTYFNLDGHVSDVTSQELEINSHKIIETNNENIPTGNFINIKNNPFDFSSPKNCPDKIDTTFILNKKNDFTASLFSKKNNLNMFVYTNQPSVHIYVGGNCFNQIKGKENANYHSTSGICFETQNYPDAPNHSHFPNAIIKKNETYYHETIFKFENLNL